MRRLSSEPIVTKTSSHINFDCRPFIFVSVDYKYLEICVLSLQSQMNQPNQIDPIYKGNVYFSRIQSNPMKPTEIESLTQGLTQDSSSSVYAPLFHDTRFFCYSTSFI